MARGGKRIGSGRPHGTGKFGEPTKPIRVPLSDLDRAIRCVQNRFFRLPLFHCPVTAGVPSAVDDKVEKEMDLNELLIKKPADTFFVKVSGLSMVKAGIQDGDILVVDRSVEPIHEKIVIASINGELTVKRLYLKGKKIRLIAENDAFSPIEISNEMSFQILGTVTSVIHAM